MMITIWIENGVYIMYMIWDFCATGNDVTMRTILYGSHINNLNPALADFNKLSSR